MIVDRLVRALGSVRSVENPSVPLSKLAELLSGSSYSTTAGVTVTRDKALTIAAVMRGVNLIASDCAKLPLFVYQRKQPTGKDRDDKHPAYQLLRYGAGDIDAFTLRETLTAHAVLEGNGYAYIVRDGDANPVELWPLDPDVTEPIRVDGQLWYLTTFTFADKTESRKLRPENVLHIKGLGHDGICGHRLLRYAAEVYGHEIAARGYASRVFKSSGTGRIVLETDSQIDDEAFSKLLKQWRDMTEGLENQHKTAILENGLKAKQLSSNARDSQLIEARQFSIRDIANILNVPPHKLGDNSRTAYNSLESENQSYLDEGLDAWLCRWEMEARRKLLTEEQKRKDSHLVEFLRAARLRANQRDRFASYSLGLGKWLLENEVRDLENMNPLTPEQLAELHARQKPAMSTKTAPAKEEKPAEDAEQKSEFVKLQRQLVASTIARMIRRIGTAASRAAKDSKRFPDFLAQFTSDHSPTIRAAIEEVIAPVGAVFPKRSVFGLAREYSALLCDRLRQSWQEVYDQAPADSFAAEIETRCERLAEALPAEFAARLVLDPSPPDA